MRRGNLVTSQHPDVAESELGSPCLTVLNYSGGKQSSVLLWMVLRGELEIDRERFAVLNADPGMENSKSYEYVALMREECAKAGIYFETVEGPNLYQDIVTLKEREATRIDNPPYFTKDEKGKRGKLLQKCTAIYKIAPMDRAIRRLLEERHGVSRNTTRLGNAAVEKWVGFSYDEVMRIKPPAQKYVYFRYPLCELRMDRSDVLTYFEDRGLPIPPRSVCNACFANSVPFYKEMFENRPQDWAQAVAVDEAVRDWRQVHIDNPVFVSDTLKPLLELQMLGFDATGEDKSGWSCDSGYCFT
jgi:hypothetical protein